MANKNIVPAQVPGFVPGFLAKTSTKSTMCRMCRTFRHFPYTCAHAGAEAHANFQPSHGHTPRHIRHIRHIVDLYTYFYKKGGTMSGTPLKSPAHTGKDLQTSVIRCNETNARQVQRLVKTDPELLSLVQSLQAQEIFPGLRCISFTLTGSAEHCAQGLDAWAKTIPSAAKPQGQV